MTSVSIVIPVFNEASTIEELLSRVWNQSLSNIQKDILVVESNSSDGSREKVQAFQKNHPANSMCQLRVILQDRPQGKGSAVRLGLDSAQGDIILIQDADLEYDTEDYMNLLEPIVLGRTDVVLGSRHLSSGSWKIRQFEKNPLKAALLNFFGVILHGFFNLLYGVRLTDPTTMYKVFRRKCLQNITLQSSRFDFDLELLGKLILAGYKPLEVPVSYRSRSFAQGKKVRFFLDGFLCMKAMLKYRLTANQDPVRKFS